uniref:uncharacterized protein gjz1 n=1 Tax=Centroberyx gerrardi TaxID=166262 RepID=UPI003AAED20D
MAAIVTGLIPILRTAVDSTTTYKCRSLWFGFLCVRLVILFLAELPWFKLDADFSCNSTKDDICTRACFNEHFHKPVMVAWNFFYVLLILSVLLMELFASHLRSLAQKKSAQMRVNVELEALGKGETPAGSADTKAEMVIDLHRDRSAVGFYLLSIVLRIVVEVWFVFVLLTWNLPTLKGPFKCRTEMCSELHICLVRAAPEKRMSIYALASISSMVIVCSSLFCMYAIAHYLCKY